jgi:hypothetical protein
MNQKEVKIKQESWEKDIWKSFNFGDKLIIRLNTHQVKQKNYVSIQKNTSENFTEFEFNSRVAAETFANYVAAGFKAAQNQEEMYNEMMLEP